MTNIEHHVVASNGDAALAASDVYLGAAVGELGCWVDPSVTRMIQTGVEHARVPDMARYLNLRKGADSCVDGPHTHAFVDGSVPHSPITRGSSPLFSPDSAYGKLTALTAAALKPNAVEYQLQLSILLKGPKGSGKFTTASWVAQHLGIHLFEVGFLLSEEWLFAHAVRAGELLRSHRRERREDGRHAACALRASVVLLTVYSPTAIHRRICTDDARLRARQR